MKQKPGDALKRYHKEKYKNLYPKIDIKDVKENFKYDEQNGILYRHTIKHGWRPVSTSTPDRQGYTTIFKSVTMRGHHIVWLLVHGEWPKEPIYAIDKNLCNLKLENLVAESAVTERFGNFLVRWEDPYWGVKVWHRPYFYKGSRFKKRKDAVAWANKQLNEYNKYAFSTEAMAENNSEEKETPIPGIFYFRKHSYLVKVKQGDVWRHYSIEKNIEDAIDAKAAAQAEVDEIWEAENE